MYPTRLACLASRITTHFSTLIFIYVAILFPVTYCHAIDSAAKNIAGRTVRVGIYETRPLAYTDPDGFAHGFFVEMLNRIAKKEQWNVQYVPGSWQEGLDRLKSDQIDMVICIAYTEARDQFMDFPKEFLVLDWGLIFKAKGSKITSLLDLEGKSVSVLQGDVYSTGFQELVRLFNIKVNLKEVNQPNEVFGAVDSGTADAGVNGNLYGILHENGQNVEQTPIIFTPVKLGYAVNEGKNGDLLAALDRHIATMKTDKTSEYYHELEHLLGKKHSNISREAYWILSAVAAVLFLAIAFIVLLRKQVKAKTEHLEKGIAERKQAEEALRESQQFSKQIIRSVKEGIIVYGPDLRYQAWNPFMERMTGIPASEVLGKYPLEVFPFLQEMGVLERLKKALTGEIVNSIEFPFLVQSTGKSGWVSDNSASFHNEIGEIVGVIGTVSDITESKLLEEEQYKLQAQLQQAQKMEAIGTLAGGIAHDFNNVLAVILGYAEMAQEDCPASSMLRKDIDEIVKGTHRARELVKQILTFSRKAETDHIPLQPASIIQEAIRMLRFSLPSTIDITQDINIDAGIVLASPTQIHQIIMNLGTNAFHAMENSGGTLSISLEKKILDEKDIVNKPGVRSGDFVQLSVGDTGLGIAPELGDKIFDPYFTTKEVGKGTGMGLSIVHGIVKSYGGWISFKSHPGKGTIFQVLLPVVAEEAVVEARLEENFKYGNERILFIDDEELLAEMGKNMLERLGYQVTVQSSSVEALTTFQKQPDKFDLVITDQTMPGMTGSDLARLILQIRPFMPIILCTGYSSIITEEKAKAIGIKGYAMKPLSKKDISNLIREVLDGVSHRSLYKRMCGAETDNSVSHCQ